MQKEYLEILLESIESKFRITLEAFRSLNQKIDTKVDELRTELKQDISVVDSKVMGLCKRLVSVEERLSSEIAEVRADLASHRNHTELHSPLKRA